MKRSFKLPDAVNASSSKSYTPIPNSILRNPNVSSKAKVILCILLSNKEGWESYQNAIVGMMKEGRDSIRTGTKELENLNYVLRIKYRNKKTKKLVGSFWAYTDNPGNFNIQENLKALDKHGMEPISKELRNTGKPGPGNPYPGNPYPGNRPLIRLNNNKTKDKKKEFLENLAFFMENLPKAFHDNKSVKRSIKEFIRYRSNSKSLSEQSVKIICNKFKTLPPSDLKDSIEDSIMSGWAGVFPPKNGKTYPTQKVSNASGAKLDFSQREPDEVIE